MNQDQEKKRFTIELTDELYKKLKIFCVQKDVSMKEFITMLIESALEN